MVCLPRCCHACTMFTVNSLKIHTWPVEGLQPFRTGHHMPFVPCYTLQSRESNCSATPLPVPVKLEQWELASGSPRLGPKEGLNSSTTCFVPFINETAVVVD